jgi:hypothetical protein
MKVARKYDSLDMLSSLLTEKGIEDKNRGQSSHRK